MAEDIILLDLWSSPFAMRVRIAMAEKEVEFESREEDLSNKSDLLLKTNPVHEQVPVLIHKGKPICESLVIVEYIDEVWSHKSPLLPSDPHERAMARFWAHYVDQKIHSTGRLVWATTGEVQEAAKKELIESFKLLERELGDKTFFGGDRLGLADVALIPFYTWFYAMETCGNFSIVDECPHLVAWAKRCMQRESVARSLPDQYKVYQRLLELKKLYETQ